MKGKRIGGKEPRIKLDDYDLGEVYDANANEITTICKPVDVKIFHGIQEYRVVFPNIGLGDVPDQTFQASLASIETFAQCTQYHLVKLRIKEGF